VEPDVFDASDAQDAPPDVPVPTACEEAGITFVYVITEENDLFSFYPPTKAFTKIGTIQCNDPDNATPFSMAVDRAGTAYVVFNQGHLYKVSTLTAKCSPTSFVKQQGGFNLTFGMGFSANTSDPGETLFVAGDTPAASTPEPLATIDPTTFQLQQVGNFSHGIGNAELTGTGDGRLFAFGVEPGTSPVVLHLAEIEKDNANVVNDTFISLPSGGAGIVAWAFAYWGGDFYFFTSTTNGASSVDRYHPGDPPVAQHYADLGRTIVGAGVSTCAPQE
jgi:hypothetical protein